MSEVGFLVNTSFIPGASVPWYFFFATGKLMLVLLYYMVSSFQGFHLCSFLRQDDGTYKCKMVVQGEIIP